MKILVVEDDQTVAETLQILLSSYFYAVDIAVDGEMGLEMAEAFDYDLLLLDVLLPRLDGISLCQQLRTKGFKMPILLLTGQGGAHQKAIALDAGADDYVVKPFDAEELIARVQALLRRGGPETQPILTWGDLSLDPSRCRVTYCTHVLNLTAKESAILELLLRNPQRVLSVSVILDRVWNALEAPREEVIRYHIKEIRKKLKAVGAPKKFIKTIYREGYQLNPLYASVLNSPSTETLTVTQIAELQSVNEELRSTLAELQVAHTELSRKHEALEIAYQTNEKEQQQSQVAPINPTTLGEDNALELALDSLQPQDSNELWQILFEETLDAILIANDQGNYIDANPSACRLFGVKKDELLKHTVSDFADPELDLAQGWPAFLDNSQQFGKFRLHRLDGTIKEIDLTAFANFVPGQYLLIFRDINNQKPLQIERQAIDASIQISEEQVRLALELSELGSWDWHLDTGAVIWSAKHYHLFGYRPGEVEPNYDIWRDRLHPDDVAPTEHKLTQSLDNQTDYEHEFRIVLQDGSIRWMVSKGRAIYKNSAQPLRMVGVTFDITDRKLAATQLLQQLEQEHVIATITDSIRNTLELDQILQSAVDQVRQFLQTDRVLVFKFDPDGQGSVTAESVTHGWSQTLSMNLPDECFGDHYTEQFRHGRITAITDLSTAAIDSCYFDLLSQFQVQANLVVPILGGDELWGLLIAHHCSAPRQWTPEETELLQKVSTQLSIALQQAEIYHIQRRELIERRKIQAALQESEGRLVLAMDAAFMGVWDWDLPTNQLTWSGHQHDLFGLTPDTFDNSFEGFLSCVHPDDHSLILEAIDTAKQNHASYIVEFRVIWPDGSLHHLSARGTFYFNPEGEAIRMLGILMDISERKKTEATLHQQALIFESITDGVILTDLEGSIIDWNPAAEQIFGYTKAEVLGRSPEMFHQTPSSHFLTPQTLDGVPLERHLSGELPFIHKDGSSGICETVVVPLLDKQGQPIANIRLNHDITQRKQTEQKVHEQAALLDITTDATVVRSLDDKILFWNLGAERLYGWTAGEVLGRNVNDLLYQEPLTQLQDIQKALSQNGQWQGELEQLTKSGERVIVDSRWTIVKEPSREPASILVVNTNITDKKKLEAQYLRAQRLESLGTLAGGIAHDLNNILTPIVGITGLLPLKIPQLDDQSRHLIELMKHSAHRGADLVQQVLSFSRGSEGNRMTLHVGDLISEVKDLAEKTFPKTIELHIDIPSNLRMVCGDATQLHQVLMNLCVNARDSMPHGGTLSLFAADLLVDETYAQMYLEAEVGPYVVLSVVDTGIGMASETLDRIFDPFFTTKEVGKGTGLGLSTLMGIVKSHGGFVTVDSQLGSGTKFEVYLPAVEDTSPEQKKSDINTAGLGELILVVDDEAPIREITKATLEAYNYGVLTANNGLEAISKYVQNKVDIAAILMDMMMPEMDGATAIQTLRAINPKVKIIVATGLASKEQNPTETDLDVDAFLSKPYTAETLLSTLTQVLQRTK